VSALNADGLNSSVGSNPTSSSISILKEKNEEEGK
jgi:hypothetical protein